MDSSALNATLKQLALNAQATPPGSRQRRKALDQLIRIIQGSNLLCRRFPGQIPSHLYTVIYEEATQLLFLHICQKVEQYNPKYEVMQWVNFLLKRRFFSEARGKILSRESSLGDYENHEPLSVFLVEEIVEYLRTDPENCLNKFHVRNHPEVTFQVIALEVLAGYKWRELEERLNIPTSTMCSFYRKHLKHFAPRIKAYLTQ